MKLIDIINEELKDSKTTTTVTLTKPSEEKLIYLSEKFNRTTDDVINILISYAATTENTDKIIKDLEGD